MEQAMQQSILMITAIAGAENCATVLSKQFGLKVETAASRKEGLAALRRREFAVIVIDQSLGENAERGADSLLKNAGMAIPLEINFAISGCGRVVREVRAALLRRDREIELARSAAVSSLQSDLRETLAGLLLQSQLALSEPEIPSRLSERLQLLLELATSLHQRLDRPPMPIPASAMRPHLRQTQAAIHPA
jgi:hypothetical protein